VTRVAPLLALLLFGATAFAQIQKPKVDLTPSVTPASARAGTKVQASLRVRLPESVHVQSDKPADRSLIPTVLTLEPLAGITVERVTYPAASKLTQPGRAEPLLVLGPELTIEAQLSIAPTAPAGEVRIPGHLRYQACDDRVCFPPARAAVEWVLVVVAQ
jgi:thiol:disulfide interchange protein DsbD